MQRTVYVLMPENAFIQIRIDGVVKDETIAAMNAVRAGKIETFPSVDIVMAELDMIERTWKLKRAYKRETSGAVDAGARLRLVTSLGHA